MQNPLSQSSVIQTAQQRKGGIRLGYLLPNLEPSYHNDVLVHSCCSDSRNVLPGDLYVAIVGNHHDGHHFASEAVARGASAVLSEQTLPTGDVPNLVVPDTRTAYGRICQALVGNPSEQIKTIGVTGTNGKTTTSLLIASILKEAGYRVGISGTLGYSDGTETEAATHTTPPAHTLAKWFSRMQSSGCQFAVMEVSSHALSQRRIAGIQFDTACVTNVQHDHLDYHSTQENYRKAKQRIFRQLSSDGVAILNVDDPVCASYVSELTGPALTIGMKNPGEIGAHVIERHQGEQTMMLSVGRISMPVRTKLFGDHHVYNCLMATACGLLYGIDLTTIVRGLEKVSSVPGRMEPIVCGQPFNVYVDYAHTPEALSAMLKSLREVTEGRVICVYGAGGDRDREKRPLMGSAVECGADLSILTSDNPRTEDPARILSDLYSSLQSPQKAEIIADRKMAIQYALSLGKPGDAIIIAGKGCENYQIIGKNRYHFDDRQVAADWLKSNMTSALMMGAMN